MSRSATVTKRRPSAQSFDAVVGQRLRERRLFKKMSQTDLGKKVGITFQQVQKYEKGSNRISLSRANQIAAVLNVDPTYFFNGEATMTDDQVTKPLDKEHLAVREMLSTRDGIRMARAFYAIPNKEFRRFFIEMLEEVPNAMTKK